MPRRTRVRRAPQDARGREGGAARRPRRRTAANADEQREVVLAIAGVVGALLLGLVMFSHIGSPSADDQTRARQVAPPPAEPAAVDVNEQAIEEKAERLARKAAGKAPVKAKKPPVKKSVRGMAEPGSSRVVSQVSGESGVSGEAGHGDLASEVAEAGHEYRRMRGQMGDGGEAPEGTCTDCAHAHRVAHDAAMRAKSGSSVLGRSRGSVEAAKAAYREAFNEARGSRGAGCCDHGKRWMAP